MLWLGDISKTRTRAAYRRQGDRTIYEWAIEIFDRYPDAPTHLEPGKTIGFDLVVVDSDDEASPSAWICWAPAVARKVLNADLLGHLLLGEAPVEPGYLTGTVQTDQGPLAGVLLDAYKEEDRVGVTWNGDDGTYHLAVRPGAYTLRGRPGQGYQPAATPARQVESGAQAKADLHLNPVDIPSILTELSAAYGQAQAYQDSLTLEMTRSSDGVDSQTTAPLRLAWQAPDRIRMESWLEDETLAVSDGDSLSIYRGSFQQYMRFEAPETIRYRNLPGIRSGLGVAIELVMGNNRDGLLKGLMQAVEKGTETVDGRTCRRIELTQFPVLGSLAGALELRLPLALDLWIDAEDFTLRQASYQLDGTHYTERYSRPDFQPYFDDSTFVFEPPPGSARTEGFGQGKEKELIGQPAPDFALRDCQDQDVRLADFAGQVVLVDFWAIWCSPCLEAMPELVALHEKYADQGFTVIGIATNDEADAVEKYAAKNEIAFPLPLADDTVAEAYQVKGFPTTFVVDRAGVIQFVQIGGSYPDDFETQLEALLDQ